MLNLISHFERGDAVVAEVAFKPLWVSKREDLSQDQGAKGEDAKTKMTISIGNVFGEHQQPAGSRTLPRFELEGQRGDWVLDFPRLRIQWRCSARCRGPSRLSANLI